MNRILSKEEWLEVMWLDEYDRTDEEKEEDYQRYVERIEGELIMYPDEDDDYWVNNQWL